VPASVLRSERNRRQHVSHVLSRNEVERDYAYNRALFKRVEHGWYVVNPQLSVRRRRGEEETWLPVLQALNLPLIAEFSGLFIWQHINEYLRLAGLPVCAVPVAGERAPAAWQCLLGDAGGVGGRERSGGE
jgi:hypothetical protein